VSLALAYWLEEQGYHAFQVATEETDPELKRGSYGWLSLRHVGVEAGMGTLGLEVNLLTPEFGPRVYQGAVLTDAELGSDERITDQLCIGETCGRCLYSCPPNAVLHWGLDKRACGSAAQPDGIASIVYGPLQRLAEAKSADGVRTVFRSQLTQRKWSAIVRLSTSYAACPRCLEVCPVGGDYLEFLARHHRDIPEKDDVRVQKLRDMTAARSQGRRAHFSTPIDRRWIGEAGYKGLKGGRRVPLG
jgi:epoxyqueuosine reductase QueG